MIAKALIYSAIIMGALGQIYEDQRCRCVCPSPAEVLNRTMSPNPTLIIADVPPNQCTCVEVVLPRLGNQIVGREAEYCLRCECKFESRNTAIIKVVVITLVWLMTLLLIYAIFLVCLNPLTKKTRRQEYKEHVSEETQHLINEVQDED